MSLNVLTQGGGTGGEFAGIFVKGPSANSEVKAIYQKPALLPIENPETLPEGYTQLAYVECNGAQYVETNTLPDTDTSIEIVASTDDTEHDKPLFGCRESTKAGGFLCWFNPQNDNNPMPAFGTTGNVATNFGITLHEKHTVTLANGLFTMDGEEFVLTKSSLFGDEKLVLFGMNTLGEIDDRKFYGRVYSVKIFQDGAIVQNLVPARRESDGAIGLYDTVGLSMFLSNGATFTGAENETGYEDGKVVRGTYEIRPNPVSRNLPSGYTELSYIQSSGTQYIDTEFKPTFQTRVVAKVYNESTSGGIFGARDTASTSAANQFVFTIRTETSVRFDYFGTTGNKTISATNGVLEIDANRNVATVNGVELARTSVTSGSCSYPLWLFTLNNVGKSGTKTTGKLYYCQIYDNDILVRDFVPCKDPSGIVGLYDLVNSKFYADAAGGTFGAGEEIPATFNGFTVKPITSYGLWKVKATSSTDTQEQNVLVDAALEYHIAMPETA